MEKYVYNIWRNRYVVYEEIGTVYSTLYTSQTQAVHRKDARLSRPKRSDGARTSNERTSPNRAALVRVPQDSKFHNHK